MDQRSVLVTGASRGLGESISKQLISNGYFVIGTATTERGVDRLEDDLGSSGFAVKMRIDNAESVRQAYQRIEERCVEMPLILVNNAGITKDNLMLRMSEEEWTSVVDTNVNGLYRVTKPIIRAMIKARWGRIVNISSVVARMGSAGQTNYASSKSAVEGFTRALAIEVASRGITVNAVSPGFVETDMTSQLDESQIKSILDRIPVGRMGQPKEVATAVEFLISEKTGYITGETLQVNGGLYVG